MAKSVLVVDDEPGILIPMRGFLEASGFEVREADCAEAALDSVATQVPDLIVLDHNLPDGTAIDILPKLLAFDGDLQVVILTGHGSIDLAVQSLQAGAAHFLTKPVELPALLVILERLLDQRRQHRRVLAEKSSSDKAQKSPFLGTSREIRLLEEQTRRFLPTNSPVLILGETGVGKGVLARWIHDNGPRAREPFVHINCAGLTSAFLDAELFGHAKGAFTGATNPKLGLLEVANHGTVFLDEIGDVAVEIQPKLLKVLDDSTFRRLGEVRDRTVDIRLIAATNRNLEDRVAEGGFRNDLYYRLSTLPLRIPPLRERRADIDRILRVLLERIALELGRPEVRISDEARHDLLNQDWPGNIRELRNALERAILLCNGDEIRTLDLHGCDHAIGSTPTSNGSTLLDEVIRDHIEAVLAEEEGHVGRTAERLGVPRSSLYKRLKTMGIETAP